jgi:hypothetical protein
MMKTLPRLATGLLSVLLLILSLPASAAVNPVSAGYHHTCALTTAGTVQCWGYNGDGQLGDGTTTDRYTPVTVSGLSDVTAISAGGFHNCALTTTGTVQCWGYNDGGQLGNGTQDYDPHPTTPLTVSGLSGVTAIAAGRYHTGALTTSGTVQCWGSNSDGMLGDGTTTQRLTPVTVVGLSGVKAISAGADQTCALTITGTVKCWGRNGYGQLGDGTATDRLTPVTVVGLTGVKAISSWGSHTCALITSGTVLCWGWNGDGQLGNGTSDYSRHPSPVTVSGLTGITAISAGGFHTCALTTAGAVKCWGRNDYGQIGDGTTANSSTPVAVSGFGLDVDQDNDGIQDASDNCPAVSNADQANTDGDSQGNACELNDNNDGYSDEQEAAADAAIASLKTVIKSHKSQLKKLLVGKEKILAQYEKLIAKAAAQKALAKKTKNANNKKKYLNNAKKLLKQASALAKNKKLPTAAIALSKKITAEEKTLKNKIAERNAPPTGTGGTGGDCFSKLSGMWAGTVEGARVTWTFTGHTGKLVEDSSNYGPRAQQISEMNISSCENNTLKYKFTRAALVNTVDPSWAYDKTEATNIPATINWQKVYEQSYQISGQTLTSANLRLTKQ